MELSRAMALAGLALITLSIIILAVFRAISWARTEAYVSQEGGSLLVYASARCTHSIKVCSLPKSPGNYGNVLARGYVEEVSGRVFDLIIEPYVRAEAVSRYEFEFSPKLEEIREGLEMVIVNRATERVREDFMVETVELPGFAKLGWWAGAPFKTPPVEGGVEVLVNGTATESGGRVFNLYVLDVENFER